MDLTALRSDAGCDVDDVAEIIRPAASFRLATAGSIASTRATSSG